MEPIVLFKKIVTDATIPTRGTPHSAGFDLYALESMTVVGNAGTTRVRTGIACKLPPGTYGRLAMRSGVALRKNIAIDAGVIDWDYRDEICVMVHNTKEGDERIIEKGERFAQMIVEYCYTGKATEVFEFHDDEVLDHAGFGSTGQF